MRGVRWVLPSLFFLAGAAAQEVSTSADERILFAEIPSVYGASKQEQKISDAPSSVTVITASEIHDLGYRTLADVLRGVRSFYTSYDRNYEYAGTRGFTRVGDLNTRILVLIDGHRLNDIVYGYTPIGTEFPVDLSLADRIEVIRGPSSSLYGTSAFFGVINVITKRPAEMEGISATVQAGDRNTARELLSWGGMIGDLTAALMSATHYVSDGAMACDSDRAQRLFTSFDNGALAFRFGYSSRDKHVPTGAYFTIPSDWRTRTVDRLSFGDAAYRSSIGPLGVFIRAFWDRVTYAGRWPYDDSVTFDSSRGERAGVEIQARRHHGRQSLIAGLEITDNVREEQQTVTEMTSGGRHVDLDQPHRSTTYGVFLQDDVAIARVLHASLGIRIDRYSSFGYTTNPRLALLYQPRPAMTLKFVAGQAFRAPSIYELAYADGVSQKPNPGLQPEKVRTFEIIAERFFGPSLFATVLLYHYDAEDLVTFVRDSDDLLVFRNAGRSSAKGAEAEATAMIGRTRGRLSYTYQDAVEQDGSPMSNSPRHLFKTALQIPLAHSARLGIEMQATSRRRTLAGDSIPPFGVVNVSLHLPLGRWELGLSSWNALDRHYADPASEEHPQDLIPQDGRRWLASVTYSPHR